MKNNETGWIDCNTFQYIYRPENEEFETMSVWQFFMEYEMRLISSLTMSQKEDLENDFIEKKFQISGSLPRFKFCMPSKNG
jgi:hypothetical protein